jgi:hydroxyacyl-ACP dehydratase HTD2-like protein with hotdog domain
LRLADIQLKQRKVGPLIVASLERKYSTDHGVALIETQDILHLNAAIRGEAAGAERLAEEADWKQSYVADEVMLFRFSALTFNSHRIHYDFPYATKHESLPELVVQGRLMHYSCWKRFARLAQLLSLRNLTIARLRLSLAESGSASLGHARSGADPYDAPDHALRRKLVAVGRKTIEHLRSTGAIGDEAYRRLKKSDWRELSLGAPTD